MQSNSEVGKNHKVDTIIAPTFSRILYSLLLYAPRSSLNVVVKTYFKEETTCKGIYEHSATSYMLPSCLAACEQ
jgi:hypothetical protein